MEDPANSNNIRSVGKEIGILSRAAHVFFKHNFKKYNLGHAQVITLHFIYRHDGISQKDLVEYYNIDKSSMTSQLNKLEKNGYIIRKISEDDSREKKIYITEKTKEIENDLKQIFASWSTTLLKDFSDEECESIFYLLNKMKANAKTVIEEIKKDGKTK